MVAQITGAEYNHLAHFRHATHWSERVEGLATEYAAAVRGISFYKV